MESSLSFAKAWFTLSLLVLTFGYGFASHAWGLFPKTYIEQAWRQGRSITQSGPGIFTGPKRYNRTGVRIERRAEIQTGLTVVTSSWEESGEWRPELRVIDTEGRTLHRWRINRGKIYEQSITSRGDASSKIHGSHLLPNGDIVINLEYYGMARLNACGDVLWKLLEGNHHSIAEGKDQSFWIPGVSSTPRSTSELYPDGFPGLQGEEFWIDRVLHVSSDGRVLNDINVLDVIYENGLERYIPKVSGGIFPSEKSVPTDITHLNDVEPLTNDMAEEYPLFEGGGSPGVTTNPQFGFRF
jgi:hypothetical protein